MGGAGKLDVVLASMPFAPAHTPSLGLELLKAAVPQRSIRTLYFTLAYARQFGSRLYSTVIERDMALIGEWIFSPVLFDTDARDVEPFLGRLAGAGDRSLTRFDIDALIAARSAAGGFVDRCAERVLSHRPTLVGLTSVFQQHVASLALARRLKQLEPSLRVVVGGANCDSVMGRETARQFPFVDAVISGEADASFAQLVERALSGEPLTDIAASTAMVALDDLPVPNFDDFFHQWNAAGAPVGISPKLLFESSRGCWWGEKHHCTFCGLNADAMKFRSKSPPRALLELEELASRYPGHPVLVVDNIVDVRYFSTLLPALAERRLPLTLFLEVKANLRKAQLRVLREAGVVDIQPGIESLSGAVLQLMRKGVTPLQNIQTLKWCAELGIAAHWNWLWGFPFEPVDCTELEAVVLKLTHLQPPKACGPIRLDRFSPNFTDFKGHGFSAVRPAPAYRDIYPLGQEAVANLAYYFEGEYSDGRDPSSYTAGLRAAIARWQAAYTESELLAADCGEELWLFDSRPDFGGLTTLSGLDRLLYRACDSIRTVDGLAALASRETRGNVTADEVREHLAPYLRRGLMIEDGGHVLALAVSTTSIDEEQTAVDSSMRAAVDDNRLRLPMA